MLFVVSFLAPEPKVAIRTFKIAATIGDQGTVTVTRKIEANGDIEWSENSRWDDKSSWLTVRRYTKAGELISWNRETNISTSAGPFEKSIWSVKRDGEFMRMTVDLYKGASNDQSILTKLSPTAAGDTSVLWWNGVNPKLGEISQCATFTAYLAGVGNLEPLKVTYVSDMSINVKGLPTVCHRIKRESATCNYTWWLDNEGMPVQISYWTRDENNPHRLDTLK